MPTYDYRCEGCGHEMAIFHGMTEEARKTCPECNEDRLRRLIGSGAGIIFKGSGFYETDYKRARTSSESGQSSETESKSSESKTESKSDKSDSKTDTKKDSKKDSKD